MPANPEAARALLGHLKSLRAAGVEYVPLAVPARAVAHPVEAPAPPAPAPAYAAASAPVPSGVREAPPAPSPAPAASAQLGLMGEEPPAASLLAAAARRTPGFSPPPLPFDPSAEMTLDDLTGAVDGCLRCKLGEKRTNLVFGVGDPKAKLVFVGEAPGADEDAQGIPFVGRAGQMLTKMIENVIEIPRRDAYICNILKCRPPGNRNPEPDEIACCEPYLQKQLAVIKPKLIVALGKFAAQWLLQTKTPISRMRGKFGRYQGIPCLATYHPAYLLRNPREKRTVMDDLIKIKKVYHGEMEPEIEIFG